MTLQQPGRNKPQERFFESGYIKTGHPWLKNHYFTKNFIRLNKLTFNSILAEQICVHRANSIVSR